jgi:FixJ family two-component response regulator
MELHAIWSRSGAWQGQAYVQGPIAEGHSPILSSMGDARIFSGSGTEAKDLRTGKTTLVALVDDETSVLSAVSRLLRSHDFQCLTYISAETALTDPKLFQAECIILDIQLPGMDGFTLRDTIRNTGSSIPCFFITAHLDVESAEWNRRMGNTPYLIKPFDEVQFITIIERLLGQP